jgi:folate-binding protein YgfZ
MVHTAHLAERGYVAIEGPDANPFLQGLITNDMAGLESQPAIHATLLSPQGKILFEFFVVRRGSGYVLETDRVRAGDLIKRLSLYKLRARITIADLSAELDAYACWDGLPPAEAYPDPRLPKLGARLWAPKTTDTAVTATPEAYHAHRIALGVPQAGLDYTLGDIFPHEACLDLLSGISFEKGCFIGQEVVSRVEHRGTARRRFVMVTGTAPLPAAGTPILVGAADGPAIGTMGSSSGTSGLALVRLDRATEALADQRSLLTGGNEVRLHAPAWASYTLPGPNGNQTAPIRD